MQKKKKFSDWSPFQLIRNTTAFMGTSLILGDDYGVVIAIGGSLAWQVLTGMVQGTAEATMEYVFTKFHVACEEYRRGDIFAIDRFIAEMKEHFGLIIWRLPQKKEKAFLKDKRLFNPEKPKVFSSVSEAAQWGEHTIEPEASKQTPIVKIEKDAIIGGNVPDKKIKRYLPSDMDAEIEKIRKKAA